MDFSGQFMNIKNVNRDLRANRDNSPHYQEGVTCACVPLPCCFCLFCPLKFLYSYVVFIVIVPI